MSSFNSYTQSAALVDSGTQRITAHLDVGLIQQAFELDARGGGRVSKYKFPMVEKTFDIYPHDVLVAALDQQAYGGDMDVLPALNGLGSKEFSERDKDGNVISEEVAIEMLKAKFRPAGIAVTDLTHKAAKTDNSGVTVAIAGINKVMVTGDVSVGQQLYIDFPRPNKDSKRLDGRPNTRIEPIVVAGDGGFFANKTVSLVNEYARNPAYMKSIQESSENVITESMRAVQKFQESQLLNGLLVVNWLIKEGILIPSETFIADGSGAFGISPDLLSGIPPYAGNPLVNTPGYNSFKLDSTRIQSDEQVHLDEAAWRTTSALAEALGVVSMSRQNQKASLLRYNLLNTLNTDGKNAFYDFGSSKTLFANIRNKANGQVLGGTTPGKILTLQYQQSRRMMSSLFNFWAFQQRWRLGTALQNGTNTKIDVKMDLGV
jgi:hypothetical protein